MSESTPVAPSADVGEPPAETLLGLPQAIALVLGSIIGVGVFNLPASLAPIGPISILAMGITTIGAICLALLFASLARRMPADGGPYAYARAAFGNFAGFSNAWLYWLTTWGGNAAIATGWVLYVERFVNTGHDTGWTIVLTLAGIWAATLINVAGGSWMGRVQLWTSILKFVPLVLLCTVGLAFVDTANLATWNLSGQSTVDALGAAMALCLFSYIGVESASVGAARVRDPRRNIPRATILGTLATAMIYLVSLVVVFGVVPASQLSTSTAPFADAATDMVGAEWAGTAVALVVVVSGFGALNAWTMLAGEMARAASRDGLFPPRFQVLSPRGVPRFGILVSTCLSTVLVVLANLGASGVNVFNNLILMIGIAGAIPYGFSAAAQIKWRLADGPATSTARLVRDLVVAGLALLFSVLFVYYSTNTGETGWATYLPFLYAIGAFLVGLPVWFANRGRMTAPQPPPPLAV